MADVLVMPDDATPAELDALAELAAAHLRAEGIAADARVLRLALQVLRDEAAAEQGAAALARVRSGTLN